MRSISNESDLIVDNGKFAVKFWAPWCGPCKQMDKPLKDIQEEFAEVEFLSVDIAQVKSLAQTYKIRTIPQIILIEDGQEVSRIEGLQTAAHLRKQFSSFVGSEENESNVLSLDKKTSVA